MNNTKKQKKIKTEKAKKEERTTQRNKKKLKLKNKKKRKNNTKKQKKIKTEIRFENLSRLQTAALTEIQEQKKFSISILSFFIFFSTKTHFFAFNLFLSCILPIFYP